jgi:hypothetical protein
MIRIWLIFFRPSHKITVTITNEVRNGDYHSYGAAKAGLKRYYTGKKCKHGHDSERYVYNGHCVECAISQTAPPG